VNAEAPTTIPAGTDYAEAQALARRMSDLDLLRVARSLASGQCTEPEMAANHEVIRRFERLRERSMVLNRSRESLNEKHKALQERFDKLLVVLQRVLTLLAGPDAFPRDPPSTRTGGRFPGRKGPTASSQPEKSDQVGVNGRHETTDIQVGPRGLEPPTAAV
jgi:hypothetical protein